MTPDLRIPQVVDGISQQLAKQKEIQAKYYNQGAKDLPLISKLENDRKVRTEDGGIYRRNRRQLKITNEAILNNPTTLVNNDDVGL